MLFQEIQPDKVYMLIVQSQLCFCYFLETRCYGWAVCPILREAWRAGGREVWGVLDLVVDDEETGAVPARWRAG